MQRGVKLSPLSSTKSVRLKLCLDDEIRLVLVDPDLTYDSLCKVLEDVFKYEQLEGFTMKFKDEEDDLVSIKSDYELNVAMSMRDFTKNSAKIILFPTKRVVNLNDGSEIQLTVPRTQINSARSPSLQRNRPNTHGSLPSVSPRPRARTNSVTSATPPPIEEVWGMG
eukprot:GCRY01000954.1.p1 GENE.GCRY01000954.1~~GCRY01000954.1.p1  ORF type:complete len:167 (+),score=0.48 GCRY01000954.1:311-811(+)